MLTASATCPLFRRCQYAFLAGLSGMLLGGQPARAQAAFDVLLRNGRVLDGSGNPWYAADVALTGDRIAAVGTLTGARAARVIDVTGLYVAPGFIDVHSHAGPALATPDLSGAEQLLAQGITTVFVNPDGGGPADLTAQRASLLKDGLGVNVAQLVPHGSVRATVLAMQDRAPDAGELDRMRQLVRAGMEAGAFGLSSGPFYAPGSYSTTAELVELAKVAAEFGGAYTSHIRDESDYTIGVVAAVEEVITVAREARLPGVVTHIKALGPRVWGFSSALINRIERARASGVEVWADQYPYEASGTSITGALLPRWAEVGGDTALQRRLRTPAERARMRRDMEDNLDRRGGAGRLQFRRYRPDPAIEGRTLADVARERGVDPIELALDLLAHGGASVASFNMVDSDIEALMRQPWTMTSSDGDLVRFGEGVPHPRGNGTFPRKIRRYVVDRNVVDLAFAIRSMTSLPAMVFRVPDRGFVRPGAMADLVVFDLERVRDLATYERPHQLAEGMVYVVVNGGLAMERGRATGAKQGRVLSRKGG
ncbi:MAG TPA: amidohydrolase family protein [Gemmatimonadales bacterium]|nr:amidohydrolase family protein [Gemmatimonadales bacterium]